jgi:hypothetical protein
MELDLNRKGECYEVVLLEAENEVALRKTHRRYFEDLRQILSKERDIPDFAVVPPYDRGLNSGIKPAQRP